MKNVYDCVEKGGKVRTYLFSMVAPKNISSFALRQVLIPVFALGRAQELCILLDTYWERLSLTTPIYFSAGLIVCAIRYVVVTDSV